MPDWLKGVLWWTLRLAIAALTVTGIVFVVGVLGGPKKNIEIQRDTVAADWNDAVHKLNIEPIYPPQEDVYVGDIYATISGGDPNFLGRSMKLWHLNLNEAIQRAYQDLPVFPTTAPVPEKEGQVWQQETADFLFSPAQRKSLSLVAFPSFTVRHSRSASAVAGSGIWNSLFGASRDSDETEELRFPRAETYGINATAATAALISFCEAELSEPICSDTGVRQMLSMVVGEDIWKQATDSRGKPTGRYAISVELVLISQVYLTRSIVRVHSINSKQAQIAQIISKVQELGQPTPSTSPGKPDGENAAPAKPGQKSVSDEERQKISELQASINELSRSGGGSTMTAAASDGTSIALNQVYPRPVVIGVKGVRRIPAPSPVATTSNELKEGAK
jgi:hypothetical protein